MGTLFLLHHLLLLSSPSPAIAAMKVFLAVAFVFAHALYVAEGAHWALLVAGSRGYGNYRHQADICHAYHILRDLGIPEDNIVTMMYDDIANNRRNPYKGNVINVPGGKNVYPGVKIDYKGGDVTPHNFLQILQGNTPSGGNGKVIKSGPDDHVFVYFADHGNRHLLGFPHGVLYERDLTAALKNMHARNTYKKMVIYIEACYSGTMFDSVLPEGHNVYAITAANTHESSYAAFYDRRRHTFLADEFSANFMHDTESHNPSLEDLFDQFQNVKAKTHNSHVMMYGDRDMGTMKVADFQGNGPHAAYSMVEPSKTAPLPAMSDAVPSYDVPYMILYNQLKDANTTEERLQLLREMLAELKAQSLITARVESIVGQLAPNPAQFMEVKTYHRTSDEQHECYEQAVNKYLQTCKGFEEFDYNMKDVHVFGNLCSSGKSLESILAAIERVC